MLEQTIRWLEMIATVVDGLLLLRVLTLKLNRVYLFVTLFCVLNLMFDVAAWWLGWESSENIRVNAFSQYLFAIVFPLVAWDVFEEVKTQSAKLRRARAPRLVSGVLLSLLSGLIAAATLEDKEYNGTTTSAVLVGIVMWVGSSVTSMLFVWFVYKGLRSQPLEIPRNAKTWAQFYLAMLVLFIAEIAFSFFDMNNQVRDVIRVVWLLLGMVITLWCIVRLRAAPADVASAPEGATS